MTKEDLENECQDWVYKCGHRAILRNEFADLRVGNRPPSLDLELDGITMDIASRTEFGHYGGSLYHKNGQLYRLKEQTGETSDCVCLYFHEPAMFSHEQMNQEISWFKNHVDGLGQELHIKHIYCVIKGDREIKMYDIE